MPSIGNVARMVLAPRPTPGSGMQAYPARVPEAGFEAHAQEVAALERQYYACVLAEMREGTGARPTIVPAPCEAGANGDDHSEALHKPAALRTAPL
jgi:hypothetical protein